MMTAAEFRHKVRVKLDPLCSSFTLPAFIERKRGSVRDFGQLFSVLLSMAMGLNQENLIQDWGSGYVSWTEDKLAAVFCMAIGSELQFQEELVHFWKAVSGYSLRIDSAEHRGMGHTVLLLSAGPRTTDFSWPVRIPELNFHEMAALLAEVQELAEDMQ